MKTRTGLSHVIAILAAATAGVSMWTQGASAQVERYCPSPLLPHQCGGDYEGGNDVSPEEQ